MDTDNTQASAERAQQVEPNTFSSEALPEWYERFRSLASAFDAAGGDVARRFQLALEGFTIARGLTVLMNTEIEQLQRSQRNPRQMALELEPWQRWVLSVAADGARVTAHESIGGDELFYRVGDTFYMGGDPDIDAKHDAVRALIEKGALAALPRHDIYTTRQREWSYRLTDFGAEVAEHLADVLIDEDRVIAAEEEAEHAD